MLYYRLLSATLHMISGLISGQYSKMGGNNKTCFFKDEDRKALDMFSFIMIFIQIIHIIFTYDVDKRDVWAFPVLLVIGNICTCVLAMNFRRVRFCFVKLFSTITIFLLILIPLFHLGHCYDDAIH